MLVVFTSARDSDVGKRKIVFPEKEWKERAPKKAGVNEEALKGIAKIMGRTQSNGVLIRDGYLVAKWNFGGPEDKMFEVQSVTKSITGILAGIALQEGKISSLHDKVVDYYPAFNGGPYANEVSFYHLLTATSGISAKRNIENYLDGRTTHPGKESRYHNDHSAELAAAITYIYGGESLLNILQTRLLQRIGAEAEWGKDGSVITVKGNKFPVTPGYAYSRWTAKDLARIGWLYLNSGRWKTEQILLKNYVKQSLTPVSVPVMQFRRGADSSEVLKKFAYGFLWWGYYTKSGKLIWYMSGNGRQFCLLLPEENIVLTKINAIGDNPQPFNEIQEFEEYLSRLVTK
jgi:CubicO group peptidase (beta-lactamase class C family)